VEAEKAKKVVRITTLHQSTFGSMHPHRDHTRLLCRTVHTLHNTRTLFLVCLDPKDGCTKLFWYVSNYLPITAQSHRRKPAHLSPSTTIRRSAVLYTPTTVRASAMLPPTHTVED